MFTQMSNLTQRLAISLIVTLGVWSIIYFSHLFPWLFIAMIAAINAIGLKEFYDIAVKKGFHPCTVIAQGVSLAYILTVYLGIHFHQFQGLSNWVLVAAVGIVSGYICLKMKNPIGNVALTMFGLLYVVLPLSYLIDINYFFNSNSVQDGRCWVIYLLTVAKATDVGGYFYGKKFGRIPLAPTISPKKSVEGAIAGFVFAIIVSIVFYLLAAANLWSMQITLWQSLLLAVVIAILAELGDLIESAFKRDGEVKDSSTLPGLGGALDIMDSLIFIPPIIYLYLRFL
jgi:phosphatidate cytidylyltransferase